MSARSGKPAGRPARRADDGKVKKYPTDANAAMRAVQALNLIIAGASYEEAARQCGYASRSSCWTAVHRELARTLQPATEELRQLEVMRLDRYLAIADAKAMRGDLWAMDRCLKIAESRRKLLGLEYAPRPHMDDHVAQFTVIEVPAEVYQAI